ncbi:MAG: NDP-sugar synthase [Chloracidobacterium sp.]|nr:NDP-sugar synthase [Chloracidobacterium sp.]MDW8216923.1 NDP-sugar synthase [Acidobacteriota bacterium]
MQTLILAGGKGTRLRPLTLHTPKPIVPIANRPFLYYQLDLLRPLDVDGAMEVLLSLSYQPRKIEAALVHEELGGITVRPIVERQPLGTAGAMRHVRSQVRGTLLVLNGDILTDIDLRPVLERHRMRRAAATLVLVNVDDTRAYGVVELDAEGRIRAFYEKPEPGITNAKSINAGIYLLEPEVLDLIPSDCEYSFEYDLFPRLLASGLPLYGEITEAYWLDIGTPERYRRANADVLAGKLRRYPPESSPMLTADGSVVDAGATLKAGVSVIRSVIGANCYLEEGVQVVDSVVLSGSRLAEGAVVFGSVLGRGVHVGANSVLHNVVLGDKSVVTDFSRLG